MTRTRYQEGCLKQIARKNGKVWVLRWRETAADGRRVPRKLVVGSVRELPTERAARQRIEGLKLNINVDMSEKARAPRCFSELIDHYRVKELDIESKHKTPATKACYEHYLMNWIIPRWGEYRLSDIDGIAVYVEDWLGTIQRSRGTKAKIRNIMSAVCTHAIRYGWMKLNPIRAVRQSAKRERVPVPLTTEELHRLFDQLGLRERALVLLAASTGVRRGELLALQWRDVDFEAKTLNIHKSIWAQHVGQVKTEESERIMPLDPEMVDCLECWRRETPYASDGDWIFASERMHGRQPLWPDSLMRNYVAKAATQAGITKRVSWHVFRHTLSTLLISNGENMKTAQSLLRHANPSITMGTYTHAITGDKRQAQSKVVEMILPREGAQIAVMAKGTA